MVDLVPCKNEKDPIKHEGARKLTSLVMCQFFRRLSAVSGGILPKFKLLRALMVVLVTCKNEEDRIKNKVARVLTTFLPL